MPNSLVLSMFGAGINQHSRTNQYPQQQGPSTQPNYPTEAAPTLPSLSPPPSPEGPTCESGKRDFSLADLPARTADSSTPTNARIPSSRRYNPYEFARQSKSKEPKARVRVSTLAATSTSSPSSPDSPEPCCLEKPRRSTPQSQTQTQSQSQSQSRTCSQHDSHHILCLVVDDNDINRRIAVEVLKRLGVHSECATDGREAAEKAKVTKYHFILMDIAMPVMDGYQSTRLIREEGVNQKTLIFAHTTMDGGPNFFRQNGLDDCLPKPFTKNNLARLLEKHLAQFWQPPSS